MTTHQPPDPATPELGEALDLRPGDTLIVRYPSHISAEQVAPVDRDLTAMLPGVQVIVLRADGMARYRPDQEG
jgi:hypothetical protein